MINIFTLPISVYPRGSRHIWFSEQTVFTIRAIPHSLSAGLKRVETLVKTEIGVVYLVPIL
jgi:hypothetical protein